MVERETDIRLLSKVTASFRRKIVDSNRHGKFLIIEPR